MSEILFKQGRISYEDHGKGPAVVLLHGFLEDRTMWKRAVSDLLPKHRVVLIDLPGHGESDSFGYIHTMDLMAEAVEAVLHKLRLRKVHLIGHSMGGYVALAFAEKNPDHVKGLCLMFSTARADSPEKKRNRDRAIKLVKANHRSFIRAAIPQLFRPKNRLLYRDDINELKNQALNMNKRGIIAALEGMKKRPDREVLLHFAPYPVHYIIGEKDQVLKMSDLIEQVQNSERAQMTIVKGIGHMGLIEDYEWTMEGVREALKSQ